MKSPPYRGSHLPHAHPSSFEMRRTVPVPMPSDLATLKYPHPSRAVSQRGVGRSLQTPGGTRGQKGSGQYHEDRGGPRRPVDGGHVAAGDPDGFGTGEEFLRRPLDGSLALKLSSSSVVPFKFLI